MGSIRKRGSVWYIRYRNEHGKQVEIKGGPDKAVARKIANDLQGRIQGIKTGTIDPAILQQQEAEKRPVSEHVADWHDYLLNVRRRGDRDVTHIVGRVTRVLEFAHVDRLSGITSEAISEALDQVRRIPGRSGRSALSDRTTLHYTRAIRSFVIWAVKKKRLLRDPLTDLESPGVHDAHKRLALSPEDAVTLIRSTQDAPARFGLSAKDRSMLYVVALITGYRAGELRQLRPEDFRLSGDTPEIVLSGRFTKNSQGAAQPVPTSLVPMLASWVTSKQRGEPVWGDMTEETAKMLRADLRLAGVPNPNAYDFHGLRHSMVTMIVLSGASTKESQVLARHSNVQLTMDTYTHLGKFDTHAAINKHPLAHVLPTTLVSQRLTGTHGNLGIPGQIETRRVTERRPARFPEP